MSATTAVSETPGVTNDGPWRDAESHGRMQRPKLRVYDERRRSAGDGGLRVRVVPAAVRVSNTV